jgi:DNA invertase Pin-like site-specific DNA recombinase
MDAMEQTAVYCRISDDREGAGLGVARQEKECRELCARLGWEVAGAYVDNDLSAHSGKRRPAYERLLADLEAGRVGAVVAWHPDRLHRRPVELERFIDAVEAAGASVATVQAGALDLATASGRMVARMLGAAARHEGEHKAERLRSKYREKAERGEHHGGGSRLFGYTADRSATVPGEAEVVRGAAERLLAGASQADVVRWANGRSTTTTGKPWTLSRMRRVLYSAAIAGLREHVVKDRAGRVVQREAFGEATWPAIVTVEQHERLRAILDNVRRHRPPTAYLLTGGLATCGVCGEPLAPQPRRDHRSYRCPQPNATAGPTGCGRVRIRADWLEEYVVAFALAAATSPDVVAERRADRARAEGELAEVRAALAALDAREQRATDAFVDQGIGSPAEYRRKVDEIRHERRGLERRLARVQSAEDRVVEGPREEARARWEALAHGERRACLRSLLAGVVVRPGVRGRNTFDPRRVGVAFDWTPALRKATDVDALDGEARAAARRAYKAGE